MPDPTCVLPDCDKPARSNSGTSMCKMHYHRQYRRGTLDAGPWHRRTTCSVDGCDKPEHNLTYCAMHEARYRRNGTIDYVGIQPRYGPDNPAWVGEDVSYSQMHYRLRDHRGTAASHPCADCGRPAQHWSYDHSDPDEKTGEIGPYSTDLNRYEPRCIRCHRHFDLAHSRRRKSRA